MKIGLFDVDGHNFPNLCLMKISAYHKANGDVVEWWNGFTHYDIVYRSRVFDDEYSSDDTTIIKADQIISGGTGYGLNNALPHQIEHQYPDYTIYPKYNNIAYGFLTRGCPRACGFCIVSKKEGCKSVQVDQLTAFYRGQRYIKLLDPNLLACLEHEQILQQLYESGAWVDFTQGLDVRLITTDNIKLLNRIKIKTIHFAWDNPNTDLTNDFIRFLRYTKLKEIRKRKVYILCNYNSSHEQDLYRVYILRDLGFEPYIMIFNKSTAPKITRQMQRWVNSKWIFHSVEKFEDYNREKTQINNSQFSLFNQGDE